MQRRDSRLPVVRWAVQPRERGVRTVLVHQVRQGDVRHFAVSRRLQDLHFRQVHGKTVLERAVGAPHQDPPVHCAPEEQEQAAALLHAEHRRPRGEHGPHHVQQEAVFALVQLALEKPGRGPVARRLEHAVVHQVLPDLPLGQVLVAVSQKRRAPPVPALRGAHQQETERGQADSGLQRGRAETEHRPLWREPPVGRADHAGPEPRHLEGQSGPLDHHGHEPESRRRETTG